MLRWCARTSRFFLVSNLGDISVGRYISDLTDFTGLPDLVDIYRIFFYLNMKVFFYNFFYVDWFFFLRLASVTIQSVLSGFVMIITNECLTRRRVVLSR